MSEQIKKIENVDELFHEVIVNGESHISDKVPEYTPPVVSYVPPVVEPEETEEDITLHEEGADVRAIDLNNVVHPITDENTKNSVETLQVNIENIEKVIPSQATEENKLVTKDYVDEELELISTEITEAQSDITTLQTDVAEAQSDISTLQSNVTTLQSDVTEAQSDISTLQSDVTEAQSDISTLQSDVTEAQSDISTLQSDVTEAQSDISDIQDLIPSQATEENKLADKNFVNSTVGTNTANYISNNGEPFTSVAQLEAYTGTVTNNDYAFVVGTDSSGTYYDRYKATVAGSSVTWSKEYRLNNSSFTAAQWASINSGITFSKVAEIDYKQDALTNEQLQAINSGITYSKVAEYDEALSDISDIQDLIPSQATEENKLADINFVNSKVSKQDVASQEIEATFVTLPLVLKNADGCAQLGIGLKNKDVTSFFGVNTSTREPIFKANLSMNNAKTLAFKADVPTKTSELINDSGFITASNVIYRHYYFDLSSYSTDKFFALFFWGDTTVDVEISSTSTVGTFPYNNNNLHAYLISHGWSDVRPSVTIESFGMYDTNEQTIMGAIRGNTDGGFAIYVRGGLTYSVNCNKDCVLHTSDFTVGGETFLSNISDWKTPSTNVSFWFDLAAYITASGGNNIISASDKKIIGTITWAENAANAQNAERAMQKVVLTDQDIDFNDLTSDKTIYTPQGNLNTWTHTGWANAPCAIPQGGFSLEVILEGDWARQRLTVYNDYKIYERFRYYSGGELWSDWKAVQDSIEGTCYSGSIYASGYFFLCDLIYIAEGNHDISFKVETITDRGGQTSVDEHFVYLRASGANLSIYNYTVNHKGGSANFSDLFKATWVIDPDGAIGIRLYKVVTALWERCNYKLVYATTGDVSGNVNIINNTTVFSNYHVDSIIGMEIPRVTPLALASGYSGLYPMTISNKQAKIYIAETIMTPTTGSTVWSGTIDTDIPNTATVIEASVIVETNTGYSYVAKNDFGTPVGEREIVFMVHKGGSNKLIVVGFSPWWRTGNPYTVVAKVLYY